jgi:hypothetical protein
LLLHIEYTFFADNALFTLCRICCINGFVCSKLPSVSSSLAAISSVSSSLAAISSVSSSLACCESLSALSSDPDELDSSLLSLLSLSSSLDDDESLSSSSEFSVAGVIGVLSY